ncbi:MAG: hypothetical protein AAF694_26290, partial [Bacteroidota bacterium]
MVKSMGFLRKNYKAFLTGGLITIGMTIMFSQVEDFHLINPKYFSRLTFIAVNILAITFIWWGISVLITRWPI